MTKFHSRRSCKWKNIGVSRLALAILDEGIAYAYCSSPSLGATIVDPTNTIWYTEAVAAGSHLECGTQSQITGSGHSNGDGNVNPGCVVTGDLTAVGTITSHGSVQGLTVSGAPARQLPLLPSAAQLSAS